ncbi:PHB depolymerase family esterase [Streptomyces sp. NBC_01498]|uniref:extracellular catalytic domain type 1 short-chain-length polyhydroxyalkanoate depolymerase n=1 Tax=Streptomyces sp. NBC_01498 TaxID=2975870 RepID=UPI002E7C2FD2|nr:PHB depolymerase family esterase [Streptomyces sp. NBC_01498]WTL28171.1 PHB depolymerase family esterase [Streptomyces sp. NBC_01498]
MSHPSPSRPPLSRPSSSHAPPPSSPLSRPERSERSARTRGRLRRALGRVAAALALATGIALLPPAPQAQAAVALERVSSFGANPGALTMYVYRPASLPADAPVVVALHGCTQSAQVYADNSGLPAFADRHGFLLVLAETTTVNNANKCFNWFQSADIRRGQGEAASVRQMVAHAVSAYGADAGRVQVTGLSAGGAMTAVMLAAYPDVFRAGAVMAGLPYECATDVVSAFGCMSPGTDRTPQDWAQRVRNAHPGFAGPWPRVSVWQGANDPTVVPRNADELRDQWTQVHGLDQSPDRTSVIGPNSTRREEYLAPDGAVAVQVNRVPGIGHGTPVDPGSGPEQCGATGTAHFIDSICSSYWVVRFFGLDTGAPEPGGLPAPAGLRSTGVTGTSVALAWEPVSGATGYAVHRGGTRVGLPADSRYTDSGLGAGTTHTYTVAARGPDGAEGARSAPVTVTTTGAAALCWTSSTYEHVRAGRATTAGGYAYAKGSNQNMGLNNTFVTRTLKESPTGYYVLADARCP